MQTAPPGVIPGDDALFLDFDGTLVAIAFRPDAIRVPPRLPPLLRRLQDLGGGAVALVSGRGLADLRQFLPDWQGAAVGGHGAEWQGVPPPEAGPGLLPQELADLHRAAAALARAEGLLAEVKPHGAVLHYRNRPEAEPLVRAFMSRMAELYPALAVQPAKMAYELRPQGATKDAALARLMGQKPFAGRRPVYLGDDTTDEPALEWVQARGGLAVKVGPGDSVARYRLDGPEAVLDWLQAAAGLPEGVAR